MLKLRTDVAYVAPTGKLTQAGVEAIQGQFDGLTTDATALGGRVTTLEGYRRSVLLATRTASASATLDFTEFNNAVYRVYEFEMEDVKPATDAVDLLVRFSTNAGVSYDAGASDYGWAAVGLALAGTPSGGGTNTATAIALTFTNAVGNAAGEKGVTGHFKLFNAANAATHSRMMGTATIDNTTTVHTMFNFAGRRSANQDTDALRFLFSIGNIASGTIRMYGLT